MPTWWGLDLRVFKAPQVILIVLEKYMFCAKTGASENGDYTKKRFSYILFVCIKVSSQD